MRLVAASIAGRLEESQGAIGETAEKRAGVVDLDRLNLARQVMLPFLDKCLGHRGDLDDRPVQPKSHVDVMSEQVACNPAAGNRAIQSPQTFPALRQILRNRPILQKLGAIVKNPAEAV